MTLESQVETQAGTIDRTRLERGKLRSIVEQQAARIDTLQGMVTWQRKRIADLEAQTTPKAIAEKAFK